VDRQPRPPFVAQTAKSARRPANGALTGRFGNLRYGCAIVRPPFVAQTAKSSRHPADVALTGRFGNLRYGSAIVRPPFVAQTAKSARHPADVALTGRLSSLSLRSKGNLRYAAKPRHASRRSVNHTRNPKSLPLSL
jgi:hypothetical protein